MQKKKQEKRKGMLKLIRPFNEYWLLLRYKPQKNFFLYKILEHFFFHFMIVLKLQEDTFPGTFNNQTIGKRTTATTTTTNYYQT